MTNFTGQDIGRYRIIEPLGQGGMATVYHAFEKCLECDVAVKFIRMEQLPPVEVEKTLKRFEREAEEVTRLTLEDCKPIIKDIVPMYRRSTTGKAEFALITFY